jgi:hypothetical protein
MAGLQLTVWKLRSVGATPAKPEGALGSVRWRVLVGGLAAFILGLSAVAPSALAVTSSVVPVQDRNVTSLTGSGSGFARAGADCTASHGVSGTAHTIAALPAEPAKRSIKVTGKVRFTPDAVRTVGASIIYNGAVQPNSKSFVTTSDVSPFLATLNVETVITSAAWNATATFNVAACSETVAVPVSHALLVVDESVTTNQTIGPYLEEGDEGSGGSTGSTGPTGGGDEEASSGDEESNWFLAGLLAAGIATVPLTKAFLL